MLTKLPAINPTAAFLALPCLFLITPVHAQETPEQAMEEVIVFGMKDRFSSGVGRAEYRVGKEDILQRPSGAEVTQALVKVPGVQVSTGDARGGSFSFELYLRGLNDQQIGLSIDGIPSGDARFNGGSPPNRFVESSNISQIVVSQSSGETGSPSRSALGGFINFITDTPKQEFGVELELGSGDDDYRRYAIRMDSGDLGGGFSGYASFSDQGNEIYAGPNQRDRSREHFDVKLLKAFDNGAEIVYRYSFNELEDNDFGIVSLGDFENDPGSDTVNDFFAGDPDIDGGFTGYGGALGGIREDELHYINARFPFSDTVRLSINPYFQTLEGESYAYQPDARVTASGNPRDQDVTEIEFDANGVRVADLRVTPRDRERSGVTTELSIAKIADVLDLRVGAWYETDETNEYRHFFQVSNAAAGIAYNRDALNYIEYERDVETDTRYFYAQGSWAVNEALSLELGATKHDIEYVYQSPLEFSGQNRIDAETDDVDIKLGGIYQFTDEWEVFAGYSENFGGIFEDIFLGSSSAINQDEIEPETSENLDIGIRYVAESLAFSLQAYRIDFDNRLTIGPNEINPALVEDIINGNASTQVLNRGGIESRGFELTAAWTGRNFDVYGTYAWQQAEWQDDDPGQGIRSGEQVLDIPEHSFFAELGWRPMENFRTALNVKYTGERTGGNIFVPGFCNRFFCFDGNGNGVNALEFLETQELEDYWLVNFLASYDVDGVAKLDRLSFQLNIDNLFDEEFIGAVTGATATLPEFGVIGGLTAESALDRYFIGFPRTVTFTVKASF